MLEISSADRGKTKRPILSDAASEEGHGSRREKSPRLPFHRLFVCVREEARGLTHRRRGNMGVGRQQGSDNTGFQGLLAMCIARPLAPVFGRGRNPRIE